MPRAFINPDARAIWTELRGIRRALEALVALANLPEPPAPACRHPEEQRLQLGTTGTQWICQLCNQTLTIKPPRSSRRRSDPETMIRDRLRSSVKPT